MLRQMNPESSNRPPLSAEIKDSIAPTAGFNWLLFLGVLISPAVLTFLVALFGKKTDEVAVLIGLFCGIAAGILCGIMLGRRVGKTLGVKILLSAVFVIVLITACISMSCCGCLLGGYQLNIH